MIEKEKCFAYSKAFGCKIAKYLPMCEHEGKCAFYKTREQLEKEVTQAKKRILNLGEEKTNKILDKYYSSRIF